MFKRDDIILLLGAGASAEAGIPDSEKMIDELESLIASDGKWTEFRKLYLYLRSSIIFADGLEGAFGDLVSFNIERLVNVLDELMMKERHVLYPFVGAWNPKLQEVAGDDFENVRQFRSSIVQILRDQWVTLPRSESADYYQGLLRFQQEFEHPLRVFSLNYDLCVEQTCGYDQVQRGFVERIWDWRMFDEALEDQLPILLYKLHGSLDWYFKGGQTHFVDATQTIEANDYAMIFGTSYKLQYVDPFLFLAYELRKWTLESARLIICIGYGFNDQHINGILAQALNQERGRILVAVTGPSDEGVELGRIVQSLNVAATQVKVQTCGAREFFESELSLGSLSQFVSESEFYFPEVID
ncbi:MAG: SIR2 family protein [Caldilineaceae bacterium]|nr:SIR2 family protein [Caldilineaceae bacterium]